MQQDEHQALYRKWRPQNFTEVCGQEAITATLRQAVISNEISHAYLFAGTRGTGKTSLAKIFSRAINCLTPQEGNPCNQCKVCRAILDEEIMDVIEMDAASNNSVDNIRRLIEEVPFLPALARYKVYIIDEVHMLSVSAFNALLKTLEEPPQHVVFILATTEPERLPATILSRCQRYNFQRLANTEIANHLTDIVDSLGLKIESACLNLIVKLADGSMRDAISLLDQCRISASEGSLLTLSQLEKLLGKSDEHFVLSCLKAIQAKDILSLTNLINDLALRGLDYNRFLEDLAYTYRQLLLVVLSGIKSNHEFLALSPELLNCLEELAQVVSPNYCLYQIQAIQRLISNLKFSSQARLSLEVGLLSLLANEVPANSANFTQAVQFASNKQAPKVAQVTHGTSTQQSTSASKAKQTAIQTENQIAKSSQEQVKLQQSAAKSSEKVAVQNKQTPAELNEPALSEVPLPEAPQAEILQSDANLPDINMPEAPLTQAKAVLANDQLTLKANNEKEIKNQEAPPMTFATSRVPLAEVKTALSDKSVSTANSAVTVTTSKAQLTTVKSPLEVDTLPEELEKISTSKQGSAVNTAQEVLAAKIQPNSDKRDSAKETMELDLHTLSEQLVASLQAKKQTALSILVNLRPLEQEGNTIYLLFSEQEKDRMQISQSANYQKALQQALEEATQSKLYQLKIASTDELGNIVHQETKQKKSSGEPEWLQKLQAYAQAEQLSFQIEEKQANTQSEW